jgi:glutathione S-transferase/RNA polymerase-associated protein
MIEEVCDTQFEAVTWGLSEIIYFKRAKGALAETMAARAADQISRFYAWLERHLGEETWFSGRDFGWTDLCVVPYVHSAAGFGFLPSPQSALTGWLERCRSRPSIAAAFKAANDAAGVMTAVADVVEAGGFKRQYRDHRLEWMIRSGGLDVVRDGIVRDNIRFNTEPD